MVPNFLFWGLHVKTKNLEITEINQKPKILNYEKLTSKTLEMLFN